MKITPDYGPQPPPPLTGVTVSLTLAEAAALQQVLGRVGYTAIGGANAEIIRGVIQASYETVRHIRGVCYELYEQLKRAGVK